MQVNLLLCKGIHVFFGLPVIFPGFSVLWAQIAHKNQHEQDFKGTKQSSYPRKKEAVLMVSLWTVF